MTSISKKLLLCFYICFGFVEAAAQYRIDHWTADDGLPQNSVYGIVQSGDGYLWLATLDGLARFDGVRFTVFNKSTSPGIINNRFTSLFKDARGDLWAGTEASGLIRYSSGHFSHFPVSEGRPINSISSDPKGNPIISASETTIVHFASEEFSPFDPQIGFAETDRGVQRQSDKLRCTFAPDTYSGHCLADGRKLVFPSASGLDTDKLRAAARDTHGNFWLINNKQELVRVENGKVVRVYNEAGGLPKIPLDFVTGAKISLVSWDGKDSLFLTDLTTMRNELFLKISNLRASNLFDLFGKGCVYSCTVFSTIIKKEIKTLFWTQPKEIQTLFFRFFKLHLF